jgi:hypothetical protein
MKALPFCFLGESANSSRLTRCNIPQNIALRKIDFDRTVNVASLEYQFMALHDIYEKDISRTVSAFPFIVVVVVIVIVIFIITISTTTTNNNNNNNNNNNTTQDLNHLNDKIFFFRTLPIV